MFEILEQNIDKVSSVLTRNKHAIYFLKKHPKKTSCLYLDSNAIHLLRTGFNNGQYMEWYFLSKEPNAMDFVKNYHDKIIWKTFSQKSNPIPIQLFKKI